MEQVEQILVLDSYGEALVVSSSLDGESIPHLLQPYNDPAFGSFWRNESGWGLLLAPGEYRERIEQLVADLRASPPPDTTADR